MNSSELSQQLNYELDAQSAIVYELIALNSDIGQRQPTLREQTAGAAFLAQYYTGIENILKRISYYCGIDLPEGNRWHVELFERFSDPPYPGLPCLFSSELAAELAPYRRFRHVVYHSYGFEIDWNRMAQGISNIASVNSDFRTRILEYLDSEIG